MSNYQIFKESSVTFNQLDKFRGNLKDPVLCSCILKWRQKTLWVKRAQVSQSEMLPALESQRWITDCLARSPVQQVCLDPKLGEVVIRIWVEACAQAGKPVFLRLPSHLKPLKKQRSLSWQIKRILDWSLALLLLLGLTPLLLTLALLVKSSSLRSSLISQKWCVDHRGKLFQRYQFRTTVTDAKQSENEFQMTAVGQWLQRFHLDALPQLFNVVRGEMCLLGARPKTLSELIT
jgi:lipopolysaccharide/colanic/teichoic acid biosynthesis glycosyltransferase